MRVKVLGGGIIGLSCAEELQRRGHAVTVVDRSPGCGASWAAAGMLSPSGEAWYGETEILDLGRRSLALWQEYGARLGVPLHRTGTLLVGRDRGDLELVERQVGLLQDLGARAESLTGREVREYEPTLARVAGGALLPDDHSVDPRQVVAALLSRVEAQPADPGGTWDATVVATGSTLPAHLRHLVRGVRGEIVRATTDDPPTRTIRGWARGVPVYVVPRPCGEVVIGATQEERCGEPLPTIGGISRLLDAARELLPGLDQAAITEITARDRPGTPDNLPLVGPTGRPGEVLAAGHFRHGVLLAPLTAQLVADHLENGAVEAALDPRRLLQGGQP